MPDKKAPWDDPKWPALKVNYYRIKSLPSAVLVDYIGDYEMVLSGRGVDLVKPIRNLASRGYRYFIFNMSKTECFDHPYGIGQYIWLLQNVVPSGGEFAISGPSRWFESYLEIIPLEPIVSRYFPTLTACQGHLRTSIPNQ